MTRHDVETQGGHQKGEKDETRQEDLTSVCHRQPDLQPSFPKTNESILKVSSSLK